MLALMYLSAPLETALTEDGQQVAWDGWAWQRRELTKFLPPNQAWPTDEQQLARLLAEHGLAEPGADAAIAVPARICAGVYLVGSWPNHTYLIDCGVEGVALIDPGLSENFSAILDNIAALGLADRGVRWVLNTHGHFDHSMADDLFRNLGAEICVGADDVRAVADGTRETANFLIPEIVADYPTTTVDRSLADGDILRLGTQELLVIGTPGHTAGSVCVALQADGQRLLFSGDTALHDYRLGWQGPYSDDDAYLRSLEQLALSSWDVLLPGHGTLVLDQADLDVDKAARAVARYVANGAAIPPLPFADDDYRRRMYGRPRSARASR